MGWLCRPVRLVIVSVVIVVSRLLSARVVHLKKKPREAAVVLP